MTQRLSYRADIPRCQAITQQKKRCARDATYMQGNKALCDRHAEMARKKIIDDFIQKTYDDHATELIAKGMI